MRAADRRAAEKRASWLLNLPEAQQEEWLRATLEKARRAATERPPRLDKNIHPSHVVEALRREPERAQALVLGLLPPPVASAAAEGLGVTGFEQSDAPAKDEAGEPACQGSTSAAAGVARVAMQAFLSYFVTADQVMDATFLDGLSGVEFARLIRLIGARETAIACRGIEAMETLSAFLRCFSAEDSRAIAAFISALTVIEPERVARASATVRTLMDAGAEREALLDRIGLSLIASALSKRSREARVFAAQKLPIEAARELETMIESGSPGEDGESLLASGEIEAIVAGLRRPALDGP